MLPYRDHTVNIPSTSIEVERGQMTSKKVAFLMLSIVFKQLLKRFIL